MTQLGEYNYKAASGCLSGSICVLVKEIIEHGFLLRIIQSRRANHRAAGSVSWCHKKQYPSNLPTASIVICFHNEEFNALFRTVSSVMALTPQHILEEIILVDDMSEFDDLKEKLDYHLEIFRGKIKLIRNKKREGLIRARLIGASRASDSASKC
eukprot:bmy_18444T0